MTASSKKLLRDLSREGTRTVLAVFAIAAGIAGFLAVLSTYAILTREINRSYLKTNPASATLRMDAIDDALMAAVLSNPDIAAADARRIVGGRIATGPADWHRLKLFVAKDFAGMRMAKIEPDQGAWPPAAGDILIERDAFGVGNLRIGYQVTVKTAGGSRQMLRVSGRVHDFGQAQARMENVVYGYITPDTLARLGEAAYLDRLNILVARNPFDLAHIKQVVFEIRKLAESRGHTVYSVDVPTPGEHPHAHVMGLLLLTMSSFGFCILALSGIVVANLLTAMMASEGRQIGVMKAMGATRGQIAWIYLRQALMLGTAAILLAVPVGILGARKLSSGMAVLLNFDISSFSLPLWVYLLTAAAGWAVPLLSASYPVWKNSHIPVRAALAHSGVSSDGFGASRFDASLTRVGGPIRPLLLALRNGFRRRTRLALTLFTLVAGALFFLCGLNIRASMIQTIDHVFNSRKFDLSVNLGELVPLDAIESTVRNIRGVSQVEGWVVADAALGPEHFTLTGLPPGSRMLKLEIIAGRDLIPGDTDAIVLNSQFASGNKQLTVGKRVSLHIAGEQSSWSIVGIAGEQLSGPAAYVPRDCLNRSQMANNIRIQVERRNRASIERVISALDGPKLDGRVRAQSITDTADARYGFDQHMLMIYVFLVLVSSIIAGIGGLGLMTTMSLNVLERRREMGVLRAIGATPAMVWMIVVAEGVVVCGMSWALAAGLAWPLSKVLGDWLWKRVFTSGLDFRFEVSALFIWLIVSIVLGAVASLLPAWNASRMTVREALSHE